jgi:hypothetical protein
MRRSMSAPSSSTAIAIRTRVQLRVALTSLLTFIRCGVGLVAGAYPLARCVGRMAVSFCVQPLFGESRDPPCRLRHPANEEEEPAEGVFQSSGSLAFLECEQ